MFGLYRVALSLLLLFSAIAAHAEDPFAQAFGGGFGAGVPSGYQSQSPYGAPGGFGPRPGGPGGPGGFAAPGVGRRPECPEVDSGKSAGEELALCGCNVKCDGERVEVAATAYQNRNIQTSQSILGSGATASLSTGATSCNPRYQTMDPATLAALRADPAVGPAINAAMAGCPQGGAGGALPPTNYDKPTCVQTCMAPFVAKYGSDPKNRIDPQMLVFMLGKGEQGGNDSNQEPTPPSEYGDYSDGSRGPGTDDDFWARAVANAKNNPLPSPAQ